MPENTLLALQSIDEAILTDVVRQDQRCATFEIGEWQVRQLSDKGVVNPDGLFLFSGQGSHAGVTRGWSVVLKILRDHGDNLSVDNMWYWKREALLVQSGLLQNLHIAAPRFYGVMEQQDSAWIWMEHVVDQTDPHWTLDQYASAARKIGRFNATTTIQPDFPWLCKGLVRTWVEGFPPHTAWDNPYVSRAISGELRQRVMTLWDERERFLAALDRLPQILSHFDLHRRNLFMREDDELIAIDWAFCGYGPLGGDTFPLIAGNLMLFLETIPYTLEIEKVALEAYLEGLREGGWHGDPTLIHLAYNAWTALYIGVTVPALIALWTSEAMQPLALQIFGYNAVTFASGCADMCAFAMDRADEARRLMQQVGF